MLISRGGAARRAGRTREFLSQAVHLKFLAAFITSSFALEYFSILRGLFPCVDVRVLHAPFE